VNEQFDILNALEEQHEAEASSNVERLGQNALASVSNCARQIRLQEQEIEATEQKLKDQKAELRRLTDEAMPSLFSELGLQSFKLDDGSEISVKQTYSAAPKKDDRPQVYEWLRQNGYGDIIKNTVSCSFGQNEDSKAQAFLDMAEEKGYVAEAKTEVHPSTLRAFVKERVENGDEFPTDLFGAWVGQRAVIKGGK
jgi:hypothetical protein